jgi:uncharacterized protein
MEAQVGKLEEDSALQSLSSLRASGSRASEEEDCGDFGIRIDHNGTWYYQGSPIGRKPIVKLFSTVLNRREDGSYWLTTPVENGRIDVEDVPYTIVELTHSGEGTNQVIDFRTNLDMIVPLDSEHALRIETDSASGEPSPYVHTGKNLDARLVRSVFYHLVELATEHHAEDGKKFGVWSRNTFFQIGDPKEW